MTTHVPGWPDDEPLPDAFQRHRQAFREESFSVLASLPDGSGFRLHPVGTGLDAERLSRAEMIAAVIELYGLAAFKAN